MKPSYPIWKITISFEPSVIGEKYELYQMVLKTKRMTMKDAQALAIKEADKCWPHYVIDLEIDT